MKTLGSWEFSKIDLFNGEILALETIVNLTFPFFEVWLMEGTRLRRSDPDWKIGALLRSLLERVKEPESMRGKLSSEPFKAKSFFKLFDSGFSDPF